MWPEEKPITALVRQNCTGFCWGDLKAHRVMMSLLPTAGHHIHLHSPDTSLTTHLFPSMLPFSCQRLFSAWWHGQWHQTGSSARSRPLARMGTCAPPSASRLLLSPNDPVYCRLRHGTLQLLNIPSSTSETPAVPQGPQGPQ